MHLIWSNLEAYFNYIFFQDCPKPEFAKSLDHKKLAELDNELKEKAQLFEDMQGLIFTLILLELASNL